ncbi:MAG: 4Fe-4S binding protein [Spirochaetales bacterium]|nr:4Fe-4S binding protein [Spirochaetales bacterium]
MKKDLSKPALSKNDNMVILTACQGEQRNCPNLLVKSTKWESMTADWLEKNKISEKLKKTINSKKILRHHKISVVIAGCPNGCSKPYTANIGLVGFVKPDVEPDLCTACGECEIVCPDTAITVNGGPPVFDRDKCLGCIKCRDICPTNAISLSESGIRIFEGGKQGRHPKLGEIIAEKNTPDEVFEVLNKIFENLTD